MTKCFFLFEGGGFILDSSSPPNFLLTHNLIIFSMFYTLYLLHNNKIKCTLESKATLDSIN